MSHGVHAVQHEVEHRSSMRSTAMVAAAEKGWGGAANRKIALLISVIALFLALAEMFGKSSQTEGISLNIKASDTWNFFQAKTIRADHASYRRPGPDDRSRDRARRSKKGGSPQAGRRLDEDGGALRVAIRRRRTAARSCARLRKNTSTNATCIWRAIITTSSPRPPIRSASCWHRRPSSPAWSRWFTRPSVSASSDWASWHSGFSIPLSALAPPDLTAVMPPASAAGCVRAVAMCVPHAAAPTFERRS